ncbi:MAG: glutathione S-transferase N-terminal domain-containing protein [Thermoplasmata archaeon]|nr:glutathione S-transferase N-terminal domain-containing protein [Thermoplasmata archaeon]
MPKVKLYSTPDCFFCDKVKHFLQNHKIEFTEVDVSVDREAAIELVEKSGQLGVPVLDIYGKILIGYDKEEMRKALGLVSELSQQKNRTS